MLKNSDRALESTYHCWQAETYLFVKFLFFRKRMPYFDILRWHTKVAELAIYKFKTVWACRSVFYFYLNPEKISVLDFMRFPQDSNDIELVTDLLVHWSQFYFWKKKQITEITFTLL